MIMEVRLKEAELSKFDKMHFHLCCTMGMVLPELEDVAYPKPVSFCDLRNT